MKGGNGKWIAITCLEDLTKLVNMNSMHFEKMLSKQAKTIKKVKLLSILNGIGLLYLIGDNKKKSDDLDRLKEDHRKLQDDYQNYVENRSGGYDPEKDKDLDDDFWG